MDAFILPIITIFIVIGVALYLFHLNNQKEQELIEYRKVLLWYQNHIYAYYLDWLWVNEKDPRFHVCDAIRLEHKLIDDAGNRARVVMGNDPYYGDLKEDEILKLDN